MDYRTHLRDNLLSESKAYGYTLSIWGAGAMLIRAFGLPSSAGVLAYVVGALVGYGLLVAVAFGGSGSLAGVERSDRETVLAASTVHVVATLGNVLIADALVNELGAVTTAPVAFAVVGAQVTVGYNLFLLLESVLARMLAG